MNTNKKSLDEIIKSSDILFADETVILHVSGNKETAGRIVKTNQGLAKLFGYSKSEVMGHAINILMPGLYAKRHSDFLEKFFKTGYKTVFNTERNFFGLHRNGFCFYMRMLIKQMPSLDEGIQYVGMIRQTQGDAEYIITDMRGVIDCFSTGVSSLLNLPVALFKDSDINIQILAPELIGIFAASDKKKISLEKFKEAGGQKLTFFVPKDFALHAQSENKKNVREIAKTAQQKSPAQGVSSKKGKVPIFKDFNKDLNKHGGVANKTFTTKQVLESIEYKECECRQTIKCEINDPVYGEQHKDIEPLKVRIFKLIGIAMKRASSSNDISSEADENNPHGASRSNASVKINEDNKGSKEEIKKGLFNLISASQGPSFAEENKEKREETKTTERAPGNVVTTESRMETLEAKQGVMKKYVGEQKKEESSFAREAGVEEKKEEVKEKKEDKKKQGVATDIQSLKESKVESSPKKVVKTGSQTLQSAIDEVKKDQQQQPQECSTPRMDIGNLKGPDSVGNASNKAQGNTAQPKEESLIASESHSSVAKPSKQDQARGMASSEKNDELESKKEKEKEKTKKRKGGSFKDKNEENSSDQIDNIKEEETKNDKQDQEKPVPLDNENIDTKIAQEEKGISKVSSLLDEIAGGQKKPVDEQTASKKQQVEDKQSMNKMISRDAENLEPLAKKKSVPGMQGHDDTTRKAKKKYPTKIITSPLYEGSENELADIPEYKPSEEELKLRKALLAHEKKQSKEKKKEKETKKGAAKKDEEDEEDDEDKDEDDKEEDKDKDEDKKEIEDEEEAKQDTQSSVTSGSGGSTMRSFYSLRAAIDEKFVPLSIRNMSCSAIIVFVLLLAIAIVFYAMQVTLYGKINTNVAIINYSEERLNYLIDINLQIISMMLVTNTSNQLLANPNTPSKYLTLNGNADTLKSIFSTAQGKLNLEATQLKNSQTELSLQSTDLSASALSEINPSNVTLDYMNVPGMPPSYSYTIWQAIMEIVVSSYRIATMNISQVDDNKDATVFFVTRNSLNNVIINLKISSGAIMNETENTRQLNVTIFLVLLIVASAALALSTGLLIPVINKVKKNKQEVFELFMYIKKGQANEELRKCRKFMGTFQANQETEMIVADAEEDKQDAQSDQEDGNKLKRGIADNRQIASYKRKFKRLVLDLGIVLFKFIFLIVIMEGYFVMCYLLSTTFLSRVSSLTQELNMLISRLPTHSLLLLIEKLVIFKDYNLKIENIPAEKYVVNFQSTLYSSEDSLLDVIIANIYSKNVDYHSSAFNSDFNNFVYNNVCRYVPAFLQDVNNCESFDQGILQKGIYSSVIKYWDYLQGINHDYNQSSRTLVDRNRYLNDAGMPVADEMLYKYLNISLNLLVNKLSQDINTFFNNELYQDRILFIVYIFYLAIIYLFFWRGFVFEMQEELWKTKSILCVLSPELIMTINPIKTFILNNSSTVFFSKSAHK